MADDESGTDEEFEGDTEGEAGSETDWKAEAAKWKALSKKTEAQAKANATAAKRLKELEEQHAAANQTEIEKARAAGKAEAHAEVLKDRALDRLETRAAKTFADPEDARALLAAKVDDFVNDGKVDTEAIDTALADLLKRKPHLAVQRKRFEGGGDGGAREGGEPAKLTRADIQKLAAAGKHAEIEKARAEGRIDWDSARKK